MISFPQHFQARHDFEGADLKILQNKYSNTTIKQIPIAWIIEIDKLLEKIYTDNPNAVSKVKQENGALNISFRNNQYEKYANLIEITNNRLKSLDIDLHEQQKYELKVRSIMRHNSIWTGKKNLA